MTEHDQVTDRPLAIEIVETWIDSYGNHLYRLALSRLKHPQLAENAVQETFLAACEDPTQDRPRSSLKAWLTDILKRKIVDILRQRYRERKIADLAPQSLAVVRSADPALRLATSPSPQRADAPGLSDHHAFRRICQHCEDQFQDRAVQAFILRELEGFSGPEVCEIMNISQDTLGALMHRARRQLHACMPNNEFAD
jgi:RNA polymerase sigma-70 factor (ECF subfamily)